MKVLAKGRTKYPALIFKTLYNGSVLKHRIVAGEPDMEFLDANTELQVVAIDDVIGTITVISPIDPDRVLVLAAEAVELYNEGLKIWESVKGFFKAVGGLFKKIGGFFGSIFSKK
jgi:hypothetical protein